VIASSVIRSSAAIRTALRNCWVVDTSGTCAEQIGPDALDFITAAVVGRHGPLTFTQLRDRAQVRPNEWALVMAAAGGLGSALVQRKGVLW